MKEKAVVCSRLRTTFPLLSAVCLNLPATVFTPQGDHVIRSPSLPRLSSCSTTPEEDCRSWKRENNINSQEATSNVHHLVAQSLLYRHYSFRNQTRLICFSFSASFRPVYRDSFFLLQQCGAFLLFFFFFLHHTQLPASCYVFIHPPQLSF